MPNQKAPQRKPGPNQDKFGPIKTVTAKGLNQGERALIGRKYGAKAMPKGPARGMARNKKAYSSGELGRLGALERRMAQKTALKKNPSGTTPTGAPLKPGKLTENQQERLKSTRKLFGATSNKERQKENKQGLTAMERIRLQTSTKTGDQLKKLRTNLESTSHQQRVKTANRPNATGGFKKPHTGVVGPKQQAQNKNQEAETRGREAALERRNQRRRQRNK